MENLLFILYNNMDIVLSPPPFFFITIITVFSVQQNQICYNYSVRYYNEEKIKLLNSHDCCWCGTPALESTNEIYIA